MQDKLPIEGKWPYEHRPAGWQRMEMRRRTDRADLIASEGPGGAVIARLRARAWWSRAVAKVYLIFLLVVIAVAVLMYLIAPFVRESMAGELQAVERQLAAVTTQSTGLTDQRNGLRDRLAAVLEDVPSRLEVEGIAPGVRFFGTAHAPGGGLLIWGDNSALVHLFDGQLRRLEVEGLAPGVTFFGTAPAPGGGLLIWGDRSTLVLLEDGQARRLDVEGLPPSVWFRGYLRSPGGGLLILGHDDTLVLLQNGQAQQLDVVGLTAQGSRLIGTASESGLLFQGDQSTLVLLREDQSQQLEVEGLAPNVHFYGTTPTPEGNLLIWGDSSTLVLLEDGQARRLEVEGLNATDVEFRGAGPTPEGGLLIWGNRSTLVQLQDGQARRLEVEGLTARDVAFLGVDPTPGGGLLIRGEQGTLVLLRRDSQAKRLQVEGLTPLDVRFLGAEPTPGGGLLIRGDQGTLVLLEDGQARRLEVPSADSVRFIGVTRQDGWPAVAVGTGSGGLALFSFDDALAWRTRALQLVQDDGKGTAQRGDAVLARFIAVDDPETGWNDPEVLPREVRELETVRGLHTELAEIQARRAVLDDLRALADARQKELRSFPYALLLRERLREDFAAFMATCRGATDWATPPQPRGIADADPDAITLACLQGWQTQRAGEQQGWWQALVEQIPPGLLILFLLLTLASLYRYNLRLAGFHDSRADALELLAEGREPEDFHKLLATNPAEAVNLASVFLAADKVELGAIKAKLGAAEWELARNIGAPRQ